jgi:hypothetical protein
MHHGQMRGEKAGNSTRGTGEVLDAFARIWNWRIAFNSIIENLALTVD